MHCLILSLFLLAPVAPGAALDKKLDAAAAEVREKIAGGTRKERQAALDALVDLGNAGAVPILQAHFAEASEILRRNRDEVVRKTFVLQRKLEMLAAMKIRVERDPSLEEMVSSLKMETTSLDRAIGELAVKVRSKQSLVDDLGGATEGLFGSFASGAYKKADKALWADAEDHAELGVRIAAVEMLGRVGGKGATMRLHRLVSDVHKDRLRLKKELPKLEQKVAEFERRIQREQDQNKGSHSQATQGQYNQLKAQPAKLRRELHSMAFLIDASTEAAGLALTREQGKNLDKTLKSLVKHAQAIRGTLKLLTLDVFSYASSDPVRSKLGEMLAEAKEPLERAEIIDALARIGGRDSIPELLSTHLLDPSWHVRSRTADALAILRSKAAIPVLIERLEADEGRVRTDVRAALESLTGQRFGTNFALWRRWWADQGEDFEVSEVPVEPAGSLSAEEAVGVTFFGIKTESQRVLFVFDVSRSMNFAMVPRNNPNDDMGREPDWPGAGEDSRLDAAKRELVKALGGVGEGGVLNIVMYATDVWSWREDPVEVDTEIKSEVIRYVGALTANGGTNIWGAMKHALDLAGVEEGGGWSAPVVDTIYLLSDGRASVGVTTNSDEILSYIKERNRTAGITIHTIGLSGAQDAYLLRSLAEQNGGQYVAR